MIFLGTPGHFFGPRKVRILPSLPSGTFYTFSGKKLVKTTNPFAAQNKNTTTITQTPTNGTTGSGTTAMEPGTVQTTALHAAKAAKAAHAEAVKLAASKRK